MTLRGQLTWTAAGYSEWPVSKDKSRSHRKITTPDGRSWNPPTQLARCTGCARKYPAMACNSSVMSRCTVSKSALRSRVGSSM